MVLVVFDTPPLGAGFFINAAKYTKRRGPQMLTRVVNGDIQSLICDMPVEWTLAKVGDQELPCFEPVSAH